MPELKRVKISHIEGKPHVLDLKEIAKWVKEAGGIFRDEDLDFIQWSQAAKNFYQFECLRDKDLGKEAPRPLFYVEHFAFFLNQQDSEDFFTYWLKVEVKLRKEHQSKLYAFDSDTYECEWTLVHVERISDAKYTTSSSAPPPTQPLPSKTTSSSTSQKSFPTGSKERTAAPCCLGCAARGHKLDGHDDTKNGPFHWARNVKGLISTPAGMVLSAPPTTHSNGNALPSPPLSREDLKDFLAAPPLRFHDFEDSIITRRALPDASTEHVELYE
ncbi:reverse transcriptase ribonuclease h [Lentinula edodes]|uniref:Reverse transcriptase ribonuclease h n=1 Tax=Lentinula edodes TaxID=5353 RepID=A0A1Q3E3N3_LENED|nr:reverse transcriptase ribonuclease h [Lentinula edodes]